MSKILSLFAKGAKIAGRLGMEYSDDAAAAFAGPAAGAVVSFAMERIKEAQAKHPTGAARKAAVMDDLGKAAPNLLAGVIGPAADPDRVEKGLEQIVEGLVHFMKGTNQLPTSKPPAPKPAPLNTVLPVEGKITERGDDGSLEIALLIRVGP
jgi:hypothetical protein